MNRLPLLQRAWSFLLHVLLWTVTSLGSWCGMGAGLIIAGLLGFPYLFSIALGSVLGSLVEIAWHLRLARQHRKPDATGPPPD